MRDFSHGKVRQEKMKDYESLRLRLDFYMERLTGHGLQGHGFTESDVRGVMTYSKEQAAELLLRSTDWATTTPMGVELLLEQRRRR